MNPEDIQNFLSVFEKEYIVYSAASDKSDHWFVAGAILLGIGALCFIGHLLTYLEDDESAIQEFGDNDSKAIKRLVVIALSQRSHKLRSEARQFIVFIFLLAIGGGVLFNYAGQFSYEKMAAGKGLFTLYNSQVERKETQKAIQEVFEKAMKEAAFADDDATKTSMLQAATASANQIAELGKSAPESHDLEITFHKNLLISAIVARTGIVLVLAYLINKHLLSSYRYNLRLATFYSSRAYSIALISTDQLPKSLPELATVLGTEALDFEKVSEEGILDAAKMVKSALSGSAAS